MSMRSIGRSAAVAAMMALAGCGSIPEFILDTAYAAAQEAAKQKVEEAVHGIVDGIGQGDGLSPLGRNADEGE